jgi:hypothetical protein
MKKYIKNSILYILLLSITPFTLVIGDDKKDSNDFIKHKQRIKIKNNLHFSLCLVNPKKQKQGTKNNPSYLHALCLKFSRGYNEKDIKSIYEHIEKSNISSL